MPERRCAFLRMADASGWSIDADLAFGPLDNLGWYCEWLCWRDRDVLWDDWDGVYLAAPCDYPDDPNSCLEVLGIIDRSRAVLLNPLELVRWNIPKTYLADLERRGADIVPSIWRSGFDDSMLGEFFDAFGGSAIVMKPTVSTNAANTWVLDRPVDARPSRSWNGPLRIVITSCSGSFGTSGSTVNIPCSTWGGQAQPRDTQGAQAGRLSSSGRARFRNNGRYAGTEPARLGRSRDVVGQPGAGLRPCGLRP